MSRLDAISRWRKCFGDTEWLDIIAETYDDYEYSLEPLDEILFELAKFKNLDTTQKCPKCKNVFDIPECLGEYNYCDTCDAIFQFELNLAHWEQFKLDVEHRMKYDAMSLEEQEIFDAINRHDVKIYLGGIIQRNVQ